MKQDLVYKLYNDRRTVFSLKEIAMLVDEPDFNKLKQRVNYYVRSGKLKNPRRGIYTKDNYSLEELACKIYKPAYISLEYILRNAGIIFQYSSQITVISYLSRTLTIDGSEFVFRKIKNKIIYNNTGIIMNDIGISQATPARAFLDILYLTREYYFDSLEGLEKEEVVKILPVYQSVRLTNQVQKLLKNA